MRMRHFALVLAGLALAAPAFAADPGADEWTVPVAVKTLGNGLTVVVSEDHSSPTVGVSVVYHVGMRLEPRNRTGFAPRGRLTRRSAPRPARLQALGR